MLSRKEQIKVLVETLEKVEKPTKWKELVKLEPLASNVGELKSTTLPSANSYRSVMSSKKYNGIFEITKEEVSFYSLTTDYQENIDKLEEN